MSIKDGIPTVQNATTVTTDRHDREYYCCVLCDNPVTTTDLAVTRDGNHYHDRTNPEGLRFLLACFSAAPGCIVDSSRSREHSWFAEYAWSVARCSQCQSQLGWYFRGEDDFYGLILDRLFLRQGTGD